MKYVSIPNERIGALIGKEGRTKSLIEKRTQTKITVRGNEVIISGEPYKEWVAKSVVEAIKIGFDFEKAICLVNENYTMEIIPLNLKGSRKESVKGRIIGRGGVTKNIIEQIGDCYLSVYEDGVGIIGEYDNVADTARAVEMLIQGSSHGAVYNYLERKRRGRKNISLEEMMPVDSNE